MHYVSTRGAGSDSANTGFCDVLLKGLADDGGLMMPAGYPQVDLALLEQWRNFSYPQLAFEIVSRYATDIDRNDLDAIIKRTYTAEVFGDEQITPVSELESGLYLLHASNGPTLAFKDIAMQLLGQLFEYVLARRNQHLNILGATSGDTGSAAEYAMCGRQGIRVFMLSPAGRMSDFQRAQMYSLREANIFNIAVNGVFDTCQDMVKAVSGDAAFKERHAIGAVNSINWARIVAQVVYYFKGYFAVTTRSDQPVSFAVPSGNFGNVLAAHIARMMGLPIRRLVVATNENNVLDEFFRTGVYRVRPAAETLATSSPSMDISKASNFERFVFDLLGRDAARIAALWQELADNGRLDLSGEPAFDDMARFGFVSGTSTHQNRMATISDVYRRFGRMIDTHTADGLFVASDYREDGVPMVCIETAQAVKFAEIIEQAVGLRPPVPEALAGLEEAVQHFVLMPASVGQLKQFIASHDQG